MQERMVHVASGQSGAGFDGPFVGRLFLIVSNRYDPD